jgi:glyoxylase-like metal-dependent hydrolase (beta-lactamase superfamily II)
MSERHSLNVAGDWYIDTRCIDCKASRTVAPDLIEHRGSQCVFVRQPKTSEELVLAWRARLLCPTASVHTEKPAKQPAGVFPEPLTEGIYRLGYNARSSWGAHSFLIRRPAGNAMVDSPRWAGPVVAQVEEWGGLADVLLTHRDDIADAERYAKHFGARVWIHEDDQDAAPFADQVVSGQDTQALDEDFRVIPLPGHTKGSVGYLFKDRHLFSGDSLSWSFDDNDLRAPKNACWYSWPEQMKSLRKLLAYPIDWVFAGHGGSRHIPAAEFKERLEALIARA